MEGRMKMSFGLLPEDEEKFLKALARIESEEERLTLVENVVERRGQFERGEPTAPIFEGFRPEEGDSEARIALFLYSQGLYRARLQEPIQTLREIANGKAQ